MTREMEFFINKHFTEKEFKEYLTEEINFYRSHTLKEIELSKYRDRTLNNNGLKEIYDSIPEEQIEKYVNKYWQLYLKEEEVFHKSFIGNSSFAIKEVENFGLEDYKFKDKFKKKLKGATMCLGAVGLSGAALSAVGSLLVHSPEKMAACLAFSFFNTVFLLAAFMVKDGLLPLISKEKSVKYLKELGIYHTLVTKMSMEKELEDIATERKVK